MSEDPARKFSILLGLTIGLFASSLEGTIVPLAMPKAVLELGRPELYSWPITVFILASTVSIPVWGRLSDVKGRRTIYGVGLLIFGASSILCGISWSLEALILFRLAQGIGSGALFALTFTIIGDLFRLEERGKVTGYTSTVWAVGSLVGPPLGGVIVDYLGWRWVYLINAPPVAAAALLAMPRLRALARPAMGRELDLAGLALFTAIATIGVLLVNYSTIGFPTSLLFVVSLAAAIPTFVIVERRVKTPFVPFEILSDRVNLSALILNGAAGFAFFGAITVVPPLMQWFYGLKPVETGLLLAPTTLSWVLAANVSSRLVVKVNPRPIIVSGGALFICATTLAIIITNLATSNVYLLAIVMAFVGASMGLVVPTTLIGLQTLAKPGELGFITSILTFVRSLAGAIGTQVMWAPYTPIFTLRQGLVAASDVFYATLASFGTAALILAFALPISLRVKWPDLKMFESNRTRL
jgi:EmrB/QacA subfamily drug resistance transporter